MIDRLHIEDFTVFRNVDFEFVSGINVLVGANSTGKTHVMKLLYAMQKAEFQFQQERIFHVHVHDRLIAIFRPENLSDLVRQEGERKKAIAQAGWNGQSYQLEIYAQIPGESNPDISTSGAKLWTDVTRPVFIPVKDMLAHSVGFLSLYEQRNIDFDETHRDILSLAFTPTLRDSARGEMEPLLERLAERMEGRIEVRGERFYLEGKSGRFEMHLVAEGWRKLALLYQLIANGSLKRGSVLYWDEPETNLNPSLMGDVVGVLLDLARNGVQIFLATHDYIILKELELQKQPEDALRMFAMERNKRDGSVTIHPAATYLELHPNLIAEQFERIYDREIDRALGGGDADGN